MLREFLRDLLVTMRIPPPNPLQRGKLFRKIMIALEINFYSTVPLWRGSAKASAMARGRKSPYGGECVGLCVGKEEEKPFLRLTQRAIQICYRIIDKIVGN